MEVFEDPHSLIPGCSTPQAMGSTGSCSNFVNMMHSRVGMELDDLCCPLGDDHLMRGKLM